MKKYTLYFLLAVARIMNAESDGFREETEHSFFEDIKSYEELSKDEDIALDELMRLRAKGPFIQEIELTKKSFVSALKNCKAKNNCTQSELEPLLRKHAEAVLALDKHKQKILALHTQDLVGLCYKIEAKRKKKKEILKKYQ